MLEEMSNIPEMYGHEVFPELYYQDEAARLALLSRMLASPLPTRKQMLEKNMTEIDRAIRAGDREEFMRLCKERRHIELEWMRT
ncbi:MAG: IDEAL domain-containing protein [Bacillota bacterium]